MSPLSVEVIREGAELRAIGAEWDALVARAGIDHPFLSHDWVCTFWESFGAGKELHVLLVRADGRLIAIAPLMRVRARMYGLSVWRIEFIANVHTPRFDLIVAESPREAYAAILAHLQQASGRWDVLMLPELSERSPTDALLRDLAPSHWLRAGMWSAGRSPRIALDGDFDAYCARLSRNHRSSVRRRLRKLERYGKVSLEVVGAPADVERAFEDGLRNEAASWKGKAGTAIALHEDLKRFYLTIAERAARSGTLSLLFLNVAGQRIAFAYCLRHGRALYVLKTGYDPAYAPQSPFHVLMYLAIEAAYRDGLEAIDLLGCEEPWKRLWTETAIARHWLFLHRRTARSLVIYYLKFVILPWLRQWRRAPHARLPKAAPDAPETGATELAQAEP
jgi:CelD/BcsL family acetyltransferase involved in cellulose biosynthesis